MSNDVVTVPSLHPDFRRFRWTKPARQFVLLTVLLVIAAGMAALRHNWFEVGFCGVMLIAASGPFLLIQHNQRRDMREFAGPASAVYLASPAVPVKIVLLEFIEHRLKVNELRITDNAAQRFILGRVFLAEGHGKPHVGEERDAVARVDEAAGIAIVEHERYRMWCKIISTESTAVPPLPPLEP